MLSSNLALALHTGMHVAVFERLGSSLAGKLTAGIGIEDFGRPIGIECLFQRRYAEARVHCIGQAPRQNFAAVPVNDSHPIGKASTDTDAGDVGRVHLPRDRQAGQQVSINRVLWLGPAGAGLYRHQLHPPHQALHALAIGVGSLCGRARRPPSGCRSTGRRCSSRQSVA